MRKIVIFLIFTLCLTYTASAQSDSVIAGRFISYNAKGDFDQARNLFAPSLQSKVSPEMLQSIWEKLTQTYGRFEIIKGFSSVSMDRSENLIVDSRFKRADISLAITFNTTRQIIGYHIYGIQPHKKEDKELKTEKDTAFYVENGKIYGTLRLPQKHNKRLPIVLIIPGSGAVNRDGNALLSLRSDTYKMLADSLAHNGIASFRYDKRGVGESKNLLTDEFHLRFQTFVDDASAITTSLKKDPLFSKVIIAGHSQGSLIGMMVARQVPIDGLISLDGAGSSIDKILTRQLSQKHPAQKEKLKNIIDSLKAGDAVTDYSPYNIFAPEVQPLLSSWMQIQPTEEIKKLGIPILIVNGTTDLQVPVKQARLLAQADSSAQLAIIKGMNHILKDAPEDRTRNLKTYNDPGLPLNKRLITKIVTFVKQL